MSQENIHIALKAFQYLAEGHKAGSFENYLGLLSDDFTFYAPAGAFRGKNTGKQKAREFYDAIVAAKANFTFSDPIRVTSNGDTVVIEFTDEGTIMGQPYFNRIAASFDISNGKVYGYREYFGDINMEMIQKMQ